MNFNVYKVEKVTSVRYSSDMEKFLSNGDFEAIKRLIGTYALDYFVTKFDLELRTITFSDDSIIYPIEKVTSFDGEAPNDFVLLSQVKYISVGKHLRFCGLEYVKLDNIYGGSLCLMKDILFCSCFDVSNHQNNWKESSLRKLLKSTFCNLIGHTDMFVPFNRDLITDDGMLEYGSCTDIVSLLTYDEYRKYRKLIPYCKKSYWTITAESVSDSGIVRSVYPDGGLSTDFVDFLNCGVRPLIVLKDDTYVDRLCETGELYYDF